MRRDVCVEGDRVMRRDVCVEGERERVVKRVYV